MLPAAPLTPGIFLVIGRILLQNSLIFFSFLDERPKLFGPSLENWLNWLASEPLPSKLGNDEISLSG